MNGTKQCCAEDCSRNHKTGLPTDSATHALRLTAAVVVALACALYANSMRNGFVMDDDYLVVHSPHLRSLTALAAAFTQPNAASAATSYDRTINRAYWRPLAQVSYAIDYGLWGLTPRGFHLTNLLLHALVSGTLVFLAYAYTRSLVVAACAGVWFALHPVHTEAVNLITYRTELLAALWVLLALWAHAHYSGTWWCHVLLIPLLYALALASKETAITLPGWIIAADLAKQRWQSSGLLRVVVTQWLPLFVCMTAYLLLRRHILQAPVIDFFAELSPGLRLLSVMKIYRHYVRLLFVPWPLLSFYDWTVLPPASSWFDLEAWGGVVALWATIACAAGLTRRAPWAAFGLACWLMGLVPFAHLVALPVGAGERFLYLPSAGLALSLGVGLRAGLARTRGWVRSAALACLCLALLCLALLTMERNTHWRTDLTLQQQAARDFPASAMVHYNLARLYDQGGAPELALRSYARANQLLPNMLPIVTRLATLYLESGAVEPARKVVAAALQEWGERPDLVALWQRVMQRAQ